MLITVNAEQIIIDIMRGTSDLDDDGGTGTRRPIIKGTAEMFHVRFVQIITHA